MTAFEETGEFSWELGAGTQGTSGQGQHSWCFLSQSFVSVLVPPGIDGSVEGLKISLDLF